MYVCLEKRLSLNKEEKRVMGTFGGMLVNYQN